MKKAFELKAGFQRRSERKRPRSVCPIRSQIDLMLLARKFLGKDPIREALQNFYVKKREGGSMMVATDGKKIITVDLTVEIEPGLYRPLVMNKSEVVLIEAEGTFPKRWREVFPKNTGFSFDACTTDQIMYGCARLGVFLSYANIPVEQGKVYVSRNIDPVLIDGKGWRCVIMPMRIDDYSTIETEARRRTEA